jgi:hypothetical protein
MNSGAAVIPHEGSLIEWKFTSRLAERRLQGGPSIVKVANLSRVLDCEREWAGYH